MPARRKVLADDAFGPRTVADRLTESEPPDDPMDWLAREAAVE